MSNKILRSVVRGIGAFLPERVMTNDELAKKVDTSDEWIQQRTGIRQRHIAAPGETTAGLAVKAAEAALADAGLTPGDIDLIIVGTSTGKNRSKYPRSLRSGRSSSRGPGARSYGIRFVA